MAAYAALVSLMNILDHIQIHPRISTSFNKKHLESLGDTVGFLLDFIESYSYGGRSRELEDLEGKITRAAHAAEDVIESHIVDLILAEQDLELESEIGSAAHVAEVDLDQIHKINLQKVTKDLDSIKENVVGRLKGLQLSCSTIPPAASSRPGKTTSMVGFDNYLYHLMDRLTGQQSQQLVIPIIGMGGIGKTTLAKSAFENSLIKQHFDVCSWVTISQNYNMKEVLIELLSSQEGSKNLVDLSDQKLGEKVHKCLFNRRYLIVLDDMWSIEVWDDIKFFFPDNNNGSRIVVTTRLLKIALSLNSSYLTVNLLDEDKSWDLFCQETFGEEACPPELEEVGKKICENCKGLPLSIVVIGGFLQKSCKSHKYWEGVARDTYSILNSDGDNQCMNILSLSYNHLPAHLKPCFLYMGIFVEEKEILVSELIKLWVAEGFLRPDDTQSLEEVAERYFKDLVDRNLILVNQWGSNGKIRTCNIHDLIRDLCLSISERENFFCVMKLVGTQRAISTERRIVIRKNVSKLEDSHALGSASLVRSLICKGRGRFNFRLLRVLRVVEKKWHMGFLEADLSCVNLRHLDHRFTGEWNEEFPSLHIPKKISFLWNLQTVRIKGYHNQIIAPSEVWEMVQLRHLQVDHLCVPDPPRNDTVDIVLPNLQTLWNAMNFQLSEEVCKRIPDTKQLGLVYSKLLQGCETSLCYCPQNLGHLHKLESLTLKFKALSGRHMLLSMTFPTSLKKLTLNGSDLYWEDLEMIGSLPNLEVLKLRAFAMKGSEWNPVEGGFHRLKFLQINCSGNLTKWNAEYFHFPVLEELVLGLLYNLEIPSGIGEIPTLRIIRLFYCNASCALSAVKILKEQESLGNEDLRIEVEFHISNKIDPERLREMMEEEGFTSNNLHIKCVNFM